jgi:ABC-type multidrug transport system fused ATPase/permease subunit
MKICIRLLREARLYWGWLTAAMLAILGMSASQLYAPWAVSELTKIAVAGGEDIAGRALGMGLSLLAAYVFQAVCQFVREYFTHYAAWNFVADLRERVYAALQRLSMSFYDDNKTGQLISRTINDTAEIELLIAHAAPDLIVNALIFTGVTVMLFIINARLALAALAAIPAVVLATMFYSKKVLPKFRIRQKVVGELSGTLNDNFSGMREIQAFNKQDREYGKVSALARRHADTILAALILNGFYHSLVTFCCSLGTVFVIIIGGLLAENDPAVISDIVAFVLYLSIFYQPIAALARVTEDVQASIAGAERVFEVMERSPDVSETPGAEDIPRVEGRVTFENVSFGYGDGAEVLKRVSVDIPAGSVLAVVGPTGVGKTTMASLLNRFYDVTSGRIMIDGRDIRSATLRSLRNQIGVVLQDVFLFNGTIAENIAYGDEDAPYERVLEAAKTARAHDFIADLPDGYGTVVGERGVKLSGGQKQRISIARAILRDAPILVLDEATASVDSETERLIQEAMEKAMRDRTTIMIAHRLGTVRRADRIIVLSGGEIAESGTHEELMGISGGIYRKLYEGGE